MKSTKKILFIVTIVLLVAAFAVSAFLVGRYVINGKKAQNRFDDLSAQASAATTAATTPTTTAPTETTQGATEETTQATEPKPIAEYVALHEQNTDMVGWIKIDNTKLDYPVMQTPNEKDYYIKRDFDKNHSEWGSIYAWEEADLNEPSDNITLFGHRMKDGSMFAPILVYENKSAWEENPLIFFNTLTEYHTYKIFAVFKCSTIIGDTTYFPYHRFVNAQSEQEFNDFVKTCKDMAFYDTGITPQYGDKLICLSTCEYTMGGGNGRFVVCAYRID